MAFLRKSAQSAAAIIAAALSLSSGSVAAQETVWQPGYDDGLLLEVNVGNYKLNGDLRGYQTPDGICVDFGDVIQSMDLPVRLDKKSRRATGWIFEESRKFTLDRDQNMVQIMNTKQGLISGDIYDTPEGWCVDTKALSRWFGVTIRADLFNSLLILESDEKLPFIEAIERKSRAARLRSGRQEFDLAKLPQAKLPYQAWRAPSVDTVVHFGFSDGPKGQQKAELRYELFASGEALGASYNARLASDRDGTPESLRLRGYRVDPGGQMLGPLGATQVAAGDVETLPGKLSGQTAVGRGAFVSNRPLLSPSSFATTDLRGALPGGWDAELYRNGQLLAYQGDPVDGRYEFLDVDLLYGPNELEVVLYGPQGQVRRERHDVPVGTQSIAPGKTWYWAGIVQQNHDLIEFSDRVGDPNMGWRWGVGLEHGFDKRTMAGIGVQSLVREGRRENYAEANLRRALGPMLVELSAAQQFGKGRAYRGEVLGKLGSFNFQAESLWIDGGYDSDIVDSNQRSEHEFRLDKTLRLGQRQIPFQLAARRETRRDGTKLTEWLTRASYIGQGLSLTAELGYLNTIGPLASAQDQGARLSLLGNMRLAGVHLRGDARFRLSGPEQGFESARLMTERQLTDRSDLRAEVSYHAREKFTEFDLGYIHEFKRFSMRAEGTYDTRGLIGGNLSLSFSFGPNPIGGGMRFSHEKLAQNGQAAVSVFRDDNGDGRRSPGEKALANVGVEAGYRTGESLTNETGQTVIDGLRPYQPVLVSIDTGSLDDPYLQPVGKGVVVTPRPGVTARIELALAPTGEIEGVLHGLAGIPREGVQLELVDGAGMVIATTLSEYDGFFLFELVPYGRYRLRVAAKTAGVLNVRPILAEALELGQGKDLIRLGVIGLEGAPPTIIAMDSDIGQPGIGSASP